MPNVFYPMKKRWLKHQWLFGIFLLLFLFSGLMTAGAEHFSEPASSPLHCDFLGIIKINGEKAREGDEVAFFDSQGILCGLYIVHTIGQFGILHVYGDDPSTLEIDEGASQEDELKVRLWDSSKGIELAAADLQFSSGYPKPGSFFQPSPIPIIWREGEGFVLNINTRGYFQPPAGSPHVCNYLGNFTMMGMPAEPGDEIAVFDPDGVLCGQIQVFEHGKYGIIQVYGDDPGTVDIDEGAVEEDELTFNIWDKSTGVKLEAEGIILSPGSPLGSFLPSLSPPIWKKDVGYVLDIGINYNFQAVALSPDTSELQAGSSFNLIATYNTSNGNKLLEGIGISFHFDSSGLRFNGFDQIFPFGISSTQGNPVDDNLDIDNNPDTDKYVSLVWEGGSWPDQDLPLELAQLNFLVKSTAAPGITPVNISFSSTSTDYKGSGTQAMIAISNPAATIHGQIFYSGTAEGSYYIGAWPSTVGSDWRISKPADLTISKNGGYQLRLTPGSYIIAAYRDSDEGGALTVIDIDDNESYGFYSFTLEPQAQNDVPPIVDLVSNTITTLDFRIYDWPNILSMDLKRNRFPENMPQIFPVGDVLQAKIMVEYRPGIDNIDTVTISGPGLSGEAHLHDNGILPDEALLDGVFSGWIDTEGPSVEAGPYTFHITANNLLLEDIHSIQGAVLEVPEISVPLDFVTTVEPAFAWDPVLNAKRGYTLYILNTDNPSKTSDYLLVKDAIAVSEFHLTADVFSLEDGETYFYFLTATDITGDNVSYSQYKDFTIDATPPYVADLLMTPKDPLMSGLVTATLSFTEDLDRTVPLKVVFDKPERIFAGDYVDSLTWVGAYTIISGYDGKKTFNISNAKDLVGNQMQKDVSYTFEVDTIPDVPTGLSGSQVGFEANLVWNKNTEPDLAGYNIYRDGAKITDTPHTMSSFSEFIISGKTYNYNVTAVDKRGHESPFSKSISIHTESNPPIITDPAITDFFADSEIVVRGNSEAGATVEIFLNGVSQGTTIASSIGAFSMSGIKINEGGNVIQAVSTNSYGVKSPFSLPVTVPLYPRPQAPSGLKAIPGDTIVTITWGPNPEPNILGYNIYRDGIRINNYLIYVRNFTDKYLTNRKSYSYTVTAVDSYEIEGYHSRPIRARPLEGAEWD